VLFQARNLRKQYRLGAVVIEALRGLDLEVDRGEFVVVAGPSGSGKTSLLNLLGCLDVPDEGQVLFAGTDLASLSEAEKTQRRRRLLGFVFQSFNLLPVLSAFENVEYPLWIDGIPRADRKRRAEEALAAVGLGDRLRHRPDQLSGGERQRVSLARALVHEPLAILADEPTANLDSRTAAEVVDLLARMNVERGTTFVFATHDPAIVARAPRTIRLVDGTVAEDVARAAARPPGQLAQGHR
jgi:putative ABC transport system ATP-binding protein